MIKIENLETAGWDAAIRGMRNPKNSWDKSDSKSVRNRDIYIFKMGPNDIKLAKSLCKGGSTHAKFRRMIKIYCDITAPLYWWKEFDTYKVGTVANSCSTMHKIGDKEFTKADFSTDFLMTKDDVELGEPVPDFTLDAVLDCLNYYRMKWKDTQKKIYWWQMIQLLPSSYNQRRTVELNYEVMSAIYNDRKSHKLDEWREFCGHMTMCLDYSWIFTNGDWAKRDMEDD